MEQKQAERSVLETLVQQKMKDCGVISSAQEIRLYPCHRFMLRGKRRSHFIIYCSPSEQTFFLKVVKESDGALICNEFLRKAHGWNDNCPYPLIVIPEFEFQGTQYYITTYLEGKNLDQLTETAAERGWDDIADKLLFRLEELVSIEAPRYSERSGFISDNCGTALKQKLSVRVQHPLIARFKRMDAVVETCSAILDHCRYSPPVLLHMDIKPANIIYDPKYRNIYLIDFEFARFGDLEYGWTQILLSGLNHFSPSYKQCLVPRLMRNRPSLEEALEIPKLQCYLFYQTMCNLIYYHDRHLPCPNEMKVLFERLLDRL